MNSDADQDQYAVDTLVSAFGIRSGLRWLGVIAGQAALVSALLYYFGWVRTQSLLLYFGLDNRMLRRPWHDYVVGSSNVIVRALILVCIASLCVVFLFGLMGNASAKSPRRGKYSRRTSLVIAVIFFMLGMLGFFDLIIYSAKHPIVPFLLAGACVFSAMTIVASSRRTSYSSQDISGKSLSLKRGGDVMATARAGFIFLIALLSLFWAVAVYANNEGRREALEIEQYPLVRPRVTLYSASDLGIDSPKVATDFRDGKYPVRYSNLRLLTYSSDIFVLLPEDWQHGHDPVYLIRDSTEIRVEITS